MRLCLDNIYIFKYTNERKNETKYKNGFTLAEVLITLGIVGVVAALTIPNLRNAYKAHYLKSKFVTINLAKYLKGASVQYRNYAQTFRVTNREHKSMDGTVVGSYFFDDGLTIMGDNTWLFTELGGHEHIIIIDINGHLNLPIFKYKKTESTYGGQKVQNTLIKKNIAILTPQTT